MRPYSNDLRIRVIKAYQNGEGSQRELARRFCVCLATVQNWLKRFRETGHLEPKDYRRGPQPRIDQRSLSMLRQIVAGKPNATLEDLCDDFFACAKVRVSKPTMCRALQKIREQETRHDIRVSALADRKPLSPILEA
ncbi:MAG: transposase [Myxococcales bacterium]|nr:transposase [Myxococcales bacterium]MCB9644629.1 transposase [Myxococcales bacterium]